MSSVSPLGTICRCLLSQNWSSFGARWPSRGRLVARFEVFWVFGFWFLVLGFAAQAVWRFLRLRAVGWVCSGFRWHSRFAFAFAGIRDALARFKRRPCAGRHLLFFAAAKKSRQKKAAHTASPCSRLRAPRGSYTSHGNHMTHVRC